MGQAAAARDEGAEGVGASSDDGVELAEVLAATTGAVLWDIVVVVCAREAFDGLRNRTYLPRSR